MRCYRLKTNLLSPQEMVLEKAENRRRDEQCEVKMSSKSRD